MRKLNLAIATLAAAAVFSGCALSKMIKLAKDQDLQVKPNPLEVHGGEVPFDMSVVLPPKMLPSGKVYTINTIYQYGDQEVQVGSIEFVADDFPNSSSSTSRKSESFSFPYQAGMNPGTLYVEGVASDPSNGKSKTSPRMAVAEGLVMTSSFAKPVVLPSYADHGYNDKEELVPTTIDFYFPQGVSTLRPSLSIGGTSNRTKSNNLSAFVAEKNVTRSVSITGTHSPEGPERVNSNLAEERAKAIESFYRKQMSRYDYKGMADSIKFILKPVVEDWGGLKAALSTYEGLTEEEKGQVLNIINGTGSFEEKEDELQKLSFYKSKLLNDIYLGLRTAKTEILTVKEKKSNATIAVLSKQIVNGEADADTLSFEELMFSATLTPSLDEKEAIYKAATKSGNWQAHNNLGAVLIEKAKKAEGGDRTQLVQDAITQLEIAFNKFESAIVYANMAAAYILQGDIAKAKSSLADAESAPNKGASGSINGMKGSVQLMSGEYSEAKASFASATKSETVTFDSGLASLLNKDYDEAKNTLKEVVDSETLGAEANYLIAIASARQGNVDDLAQSLSIAIEKDPSLKERALSDMEFTNYADAVAEAVK